MADTPSMRLEPVGDLLNQQAISKLVSEGVNAAYSSQHVDVKPAVFGLTVRDHDTSSAQTMRAMTDATPTGNLGSYLNPVNWLNINDIAMKSASLADNDLTHLSATGKLVSSQGLFTMGGRYNQDYTMVNPVNGQREQTKLVCEGTQSATSPDIETESCNGFLYKGNEQIARLAVNVQYSSSRFVPMLLGYEDEDHKTKTVETKIFGMDGHPIGTIDYSQSIGASGMDVSIKSKPGA